MFHINTSEVVNQNKKSNQMGISVAPPQSDYSSTEIRIELVFGMLVFEERGKPEYPEKNLSSREESQQQTQPTYGVESGNRSRATLVGGVLSPLHHPCSPKLYVEA